ncbi:MAG: DNA cytosine methyltransferase [Flavobacteriales bacterium]|nr:DNA cytosine methyltransferase [Flavobacteriales bacterium]
MKIASLFSGAGGLDLGFLRVGHEVIWANDNYEDAVMSYKENIGHHVVLDDIKNIDSNAIPDHDMLIGGFPCQGFSVANTGRSKNDERNSLYLEFLRVLLDKKPKFFVAENVKGILSLDKGAVFDLIISDFEKTGYNVKYKILNSADYGVPQKRERVIIIGTRRDLNISIDHPVPTHSRVSTLHNSLSPWVSVGDALENIPDPDGDHNLVNHTYSKFKLKFNGYMGNRFIDPEKPAPTVTARGDSKGGVVVLHHPNNKRRMSVRELATVQSFPLNFKFSGTNSSAYRQIGNAVPPDMAEAIAREFPLNLDNIKYENANETICQL